MIHALLFPLALALFALQATQPAPATAQTFAECQAWLCLPGGFPPTECTPAEQAVRARLLAGQPALPTWASCAQRWGWDMAVLSHTEPRTESCPSGGAASNGVCRYTGANGCTYSYQSRETVTVTVAVDGSSAFQPNHPYSIATRSAGTPALDPPTQDPLFCQPPPPPPTIPGGSCTQTAGPGVPPPYYIVTTGCPCPSGYPFPWSQGGRLYCLANPGRP